jgi:hypothetical protein
MVYLALDTCVWIELLKVNLTSDHNEFDELLYWIDRKEIMSITTENLIREWNRQKDDQFDSVFKVHKNFLSTMRINENALPYQETDYLKDLIRNRIQRVDAMLTSRSEIAKEKNGIILEAWQRCRDRLAPNYSKESFRDTVNILCLLDYLKQKQIKGCFFSTINYKDFSAVGPNMRYECHPQLKSKFEEAGLEYVFFDSDMNRNKLFNVHLKKQLSDYTAYLGEKRKKELEAKQESNRSSLFTVDIPQDEYLDNLQHIDTILSKRKLGSLDRQIINLLINSHDSYKQYFLRKVGENGLV